MTQRKVVGGYLDDDGDECNVLSDGSHWYYVDGKWRCAAPPLPPEALGEVAVGSGEIKVGDAVTLAGTVEDVAPCQRRVNIGGYVVWLPSPTMTKVPR